MTTTKPAATASIKPPSEHRPRGADELKGLEQHVRPLARQDWRTLDLFPDLRAGTEIHRKLRAVLDGAHPGLLAGFLPGGHGVTGIAIVSLSSEGRIMPAASAVLGSHPETNNAPVIEAVHASSGISGVPIDEGLIAWLADHFKDEGVTEIFVVCPAGNTSLRSALDALEELEDRWFKPEQLGEELFRIALG